MISQPFNVGHGSKGGRFLRLCLAALAHPAGPMTRALCRRRLRTVVMAGIARAWRAG